MIASVTGTVASLGPDAAVLEVGGVGLTVLCAPGTLAGLRVGEPARLATALVVREDSLTLFGFASDDERAVFDVLQGVSGIGPRLAQSVLAVHSPDGLRAAVATDDLAALTLVPGIGRKGAARLVLELKDRLGTPTGDVGRVVVAATATAAWREQLRSALAGLGWGPRDVDEVLVAVTPYAEGADGEDPAGDPPDLAALLRRSLQLLSRS